MVDGLDSFDAVIVLRLHNAPSETVDCLVPTVVRTKRDRATSGRSNSSRNEQVRWGGVASVCYSVELEPWTESGEQWRRLRITWPDRPVGHSKVQTLYVGDDGLIRRFDYEIDIAGASRGAHYVTGYAELDGIMTPNMHTILLRDDQDEAMPEPSDGDDRRRGGCLHRALTIREWKELEDGRVSPRVS